MTRRTAIPGLDTPARTDLAVLKPFNATAAGNADDLGFARFVANLPWWLPAGLAFAFAFMMWPAIAYAQSVDYTIGDAFTALVRWLPFLVFQGFAFNILISVVTMALGTITGVVLGLMQISPNPAISRPAWLITQTDLFAAAISGAPVSNMISAYGGIRWGTGMSRQFQYERTQSRLGGTLWEATPRFVENSPVFYLDQVQTPVLILHNDQDGAVPWYQGIEMFMGLRRLGKPAWMLNYNNEPRWVGWI